MDEQLFGEQNKDGGEKSSKLSASAEGRRKFSAALGLPTAEGRKLNSATGLDDAGEGVVLVVFYTLAFLYSLVGLSPLALPLLPVLVVVCMICLILLK